MPDLINSNGNSFSQIHNDNSRLNGGMSPENAVSHDIPWNRLTERLRLIGLIPHDVGGFGVCFFKSVSHQLYRTAHLHLEIRMAIYRITQNCILKAFLMITGITIFNKCQNKAHGVIISLCKQWCHSYHRI